MVARLFYSQKTIKMKYLKLFLLLFAAASLATAVRAQQFNGDMNHNDVLDVDDVTMLIGGYLTGEAEVVGPEVNHFHVDNSLVAGTWYRSKTDKLVLNTDGTTDYGSGYTYRFLPSQGCILFLNAVRTPVDYIKVVYFGYNGIGKYMAVKFPTDKGLTIYYTEPVQPVTSIILSQTTLNLQLDSNPVRLTATVEPTDADNTAVTWSSSNEEVATVSTRGSVEALNEGTAIITCTAADGSGVIATCEVIVDRGNYHNGHEYVDLGLSVKWATMNVGANSPEDYGNYFAWGETEPKDTYNWSTYKWCKGEWTTQTKYCTSSSYGTVDNKTMLEPEDDAACVNWGGNWRMPTSVELNELKEKCTWTWTNQNGVYGHNVTTPNGNSIFLPAAGSYEETTVHEAESYGYYCSSSLSTQSPDRARYLNISSSSVVLDSYGSHRWRGRSVRAVCP